MVLRGSFRPGVDGEEFCDRRILARIHRSTVGRLRREVEPVPQSSFMRFLFRWQNASIEWQVSGEGGLLDAIEKLQGFETAAAAWEPELLARRVTDYEPGLLERLCTGGEVAWGRFSRSNGTASGGEAAPRAAPLTRSSVITLCLRDALDWLAEPSRENAGDLSGAAAEIMEVLSSRGACFQADLVSRTRRLPSDVEEALWMLAANGLVTSDSIAPLRARLDGNRNRGRPERKRAEGRDRNSRDMGRDPIRTHPTGSEPPASHRLRAQRQGGTGRWSVLESLDPAEDSLDVKARQLLLRYGVVFPELLARERMAPHWRDLVRVYRRLEARGEIRGGRFVSGFVGEQFALPDAVTELRETHRAPATGKLEVVSACDPLNMAGIATPGERVPAQPGNRVVFRDGVPVASLERGVVVNRSNADRETMSAAATLLYGPTRAFLPEQRKPFDAYQASIDRAWPVPVRGDAGEQAEGVRFNLN